MIEHIGVKACPSCGSSVTETQRDQPALLRHGGYGETTRTTVVACVACDWFLETERGAVAP